MLHRAIYIFLIAAFLLAEALYLIGFIPPVHDKLIRIFSSHQGMITLDALTLSYLILLLSARPRKQTVFFAVLIGTLLAAAYLWLLQPPFKQWLNHFDLWLGMIGLVCPLLFAYDWKFGPVEERTKNAKLLSFFGLLVLYAFCAEIYLTITSVMQPVTYDTLMYAFDGTLGFQPSQIFGKILRSGGKPLVIFGDLAYKSLALFLIAMYGMQIASSSKQPYNALKFLIVSGTAALLVYHLFPVAGPRYIFSAQYFPDNLPSVSEMGLDPLIVQPAARNGMPSMHFGWALALWLMAQFQSRTTRWIYLVNLGLMIFTTLGLGEHYLIDLVVAVPFVLALLAMCVDTLSWQDPLRYRSFLVGIGLYLAWLVALRFGIGIFMAVPGLSWLCIIISTAICVPFYRRLQRAPTCSVNDFEDLVASPQLPEQRKYRSERRYVGMLFFMSGAAALVYQVLFSKELSYVFGSQAVATYTVLATYMGGMAIGAWLGGKLAANLTKPLHAYAFCEFVIGLYCLFTPLIFAGLQDMYVLVGASALDQPAILLGLRLGLGGLGLLIPTTLMGMTLPILARHFERRAETLGYSVSLLYGANTLGAGVGALLAGYAIIPMLGIIKTTLLSVALNFAVALLALGLHKKPGAPATASASLPSDQSALGVDRDTLRRGLLALVILAIGGFVTLSIEVDYVHLLAVVAGNSTYAFSLMLFAFLIGLGGGAEFARWLLARQFDRAQVLIFLELCLAMSIFATAYAWDGIPRYFASFEKYPIYLGFGAREVIRGSVCFLTMFPAAFFIGTIFPVAIEEVGAAFPKRQIAMLGWASALNTLGNILGVLATGFILLPAIGALKANQLLAGLCILLAIGVAATVRKLSRPSVLAAISVVSLCDFLQPAALNYDELTTGANVYFKKQNFGQVVAHAESLDGGLTTANERRVDNGSVLVRTLLTNGKFQGNNSLSGEMQAQAGFALAPLMHTSKRDNALVIGFGTGTTTRAFHAAGFRDLEIAELSADIYNMAASYFREVNDGVLEQSGVAAHVIDGRNLLMLSDKSYDVISIEVSSIWFAGASSLYNREFYQLAKHRLRHDGILQQWMQLHHTTILDMISILSTIRVEFDYVWVYFLGGQAVIVASNDVTSAPTQDRVRALDASASPNLKPFLALFNEGAKSINEGLLLNPEGVNRMLESTGMPKEFFISTDDNLFLEYSTPRGNALETMGTLQTNLRFLGKFKEGR